RFRQDLRVDEGYQRVARLYRLDPNGRRSGFGRELADELFEEASLSGQFRPIHGEEQCDFVSSDIDKGIAVRRWLSEFGGSMGEIGTPDGKPLVAAIGDSISDIPLLGLARQALAPSNADGALRRTRPWIARRGYQAGTWQAVAQVIGHPPGDCAICRLPAM